MNAPIPSRENIIFGIFAWRLGYIDQDQLSAAMKHCLADDTKQLGTIFVELNFISPETKLKLEQLIQDQLRHHGGDLEQSWTSLHCQPELLTTLAGTAADTEPLPRRDPLLLGEQLGETLPVTGQLKLLELHAQGGLGRVYRASDETLGREVALKEVRPDVGVESEAHARFLREARINGRLQHPNIVPVYSTGTRNDGRPFYTMRMVEGQTFSNSIRDLHQSRRAVDYHATEFRGLIDRLTDVAQAVGYAHSHGILHRDLKPDNVLVGEYGETLVIDWGLARLPQDNESADETNGGGAATPVDDRDSAATRQGQILGTVGYAPPEQLNGRVDLISQRSDVYALGAMLYQILVGESPVRHKSTERNLNELLKVAVEGDFVAPRRENHSVPKSLSAICMKALQPNPDERYASAQEFLAELERWKADLPVEAAKDSIADRMLRLARKYRGAALGTAATLVGIAVVSAVALVLVNAARARESQAKQAATVLAEDKTQLAEQNQHVVDSFVAAFRSPDPDQPGATSGMSAVDVLNQALERLEKDDALRGDPLVRASMLEAIGRSFRGLGAYEPAVKALEESRRESQQQLGQRDPLTIIRTSALAGVYMLVGRVDEAIELCEPALQAAEEVLGPDHPTTLVVMNNLGEAVRIAGRYQDAIAILQEVVDRSSTNPEVDPGDKISGMVNLANAYYWDGQYEQAAEFFQKTLDESIASLGELNPRTLTTKNNLASVYKDLWRFDESIALYEEVLTQLREKIGPQHPNTLSTIGNLANAYSSAGRVEEAFPLYEEALAGMKTALGVEHPLTLGTMNNHAYALKRTGDVEGALSILEEVLEQMTSSLGPNHPNTLVIMTNVADAKRSLGQFEEAAELFHTVLQRRQEALGEDHPSTFKAMAQLAGCYLRTGRVDQAVTLIEQAVAGQKDKLGLEHFLTKYTMDNVTQFYLAAGRLDEARKSADEVLNLRTEQQARAKPTALPSLLLASDVRLRQGEYDAARSLAEEYLALLKANAGSGNLAEGNLALAEACLGQQQIDAAERAVKSVLTIDELTEWQRARAQNTSATVTAAGNSPEQAEADLVASAEFLIQALEQAAPQDYWHIERACQRAIEYFESRQMDDDVSQWKERLTKVQREIDQMCYGGDTTRSNE